MEKVGVLQELNSLFATGELPSLFSNDEMNGILHVSHSENICVELFYRCLSELIFVFLTGPGSVHQERLSQRGYSSNAVFHRTHRTLLSSGHVSLSLLYPPHLHVTVSLSSLYFLPTPQWGTPLIWTPMDRKVSKLVWHFYFK